MLTKKIKELHFDNYEEREEQMKMYAKTGWKILRFGSEDDWFFKCSKEFKK